MLRNNLQYRISVVSYQDKPDVGIAVEFMLPGHSGTIRLPIDQVQDQLEGTNLITTEFSFASNGGIIETSEGTFHIKMANGDHKEFVTSSFTDIDLKKRLGIYE